MAITTRQNSLLVAEDWKKIYQTFKEADFQSYDFETLRKSMIDYLRVYYPEEFNDFIESSEFISLIDLIAFLGQGLAFRTDLNARENFIDTAERRDSILKLARLINYIPKRNNAASGLMKIVSVRTTESIFDSDSVNLSGVTINWNDRTNGNWQEQFITILNAALVNSQRIGRPGNSAVINNIKTDEYQLSLPTTSSPPIFPFSTTVEGISMNFEVVGATSLGSITLYETDPKPGGIFNIVHRNDKLGNNSVNTGFFMHFKQGKIERRVINLEERLPNRVVSINVPNINNTDVWLYKLDSFGNPTEQWVKVPAITGNNVAYNSLPSANRNLYQVNTRVSDQIDLVFGDGVFSEIPQGTFAVYFRVSAGSTYKISPNEMASISVDVPYITRQGRIETLTLTGSLQYTVTNSSISETIDEIRQRAPQQFYTQNRIVTGEDYNTFPFAAFNNIIKVKAVNRTSSGISRYFDVIDTTGKYSSTNIYSDDGWFYREDATGTFSFTFSNNNDILRVIREQVSSVLSSKEQTNFYYENFEGFSLTNLFWEASTVSTNQTTGYFKNELGVPQAIGTYVLDNRRYIRPRCLLKIAAPAGSYFDSNNYLKVGVPTREGDRLYYYTSVTTVVEDGTNQGRGVFDTGLGPVAMNEIVPDGAIIERVYAAFANILSAEVEQQILEEVSAYRDFGIRYDRDLQEYVLISSDDLDIVSDFSLASAGTSNDSSWLIRFASDGETYDVVYRKLDFVFESKKQTRFYFDPKVRVYDTRTASVIADTIKILKINSTPDNFGAGLGYDYPLTVHNVFMESDGYEDTTKIKVTYPDSDQDDIPDNIDVFKLVVNPDFEPEKKYVYFLRRLDSYNNERYEPVDIGVIYDDKATLAELEVVKNSYNNGQVFFATSEKKFYKLVVNGAVRELVEQNVPGQDYYRYRVGRGGLYFQYKHNSPSNRRVDPSPNNIIDLYVLTRNYETSFRTWVYDSTGRVSMPLPPSSDELAVEFAELEKYKPVSDAILFSSAKFKLLFGDKADESLRARFKVVKNSNSLISDTEIKSRMVEAINNYFELGNWDFGDTFYFSELSTYLHTALSPNVSSIVLVPENNQQAFGSLYQINCNPDEIFISAATVDNIDIIASITSTQLNQI